MVCVLGDMDSFLSARTLPGVLGAALGHSRGLLWTGRLRPAGVGGWPWAFCCGRGPPLRIWILAAVRSPGPWAQAAESQRVSGSALGHSRGLLWVGLYTILPSPILYGVWHNKGGGGGGAFIAQWTCNGFAIG